ncbi:MAG: DJ-1/PfpI family protein [Eggerthellaceae bacterium]|nr:DJ-1/PfpI family protein [Eggerthellaceae bacterium]
MRGPICVFLAEGFEEIEALTVVDVLRRAQLPVQTVAVMGSADNAGNAMVTGAHGITVLADTFIDTIDPDAVDMLVLPGGMPGTTNLEACVPPCQMLTTFAEESRPLSAICAAPMVLGHLGLLKGRYATIYPGMEDELVGANPMQDAVVVDGNITTSRGPATALPFALALVERYRGTDAATGIAQGMVKYW